MSRGSRDVGFWTWARLVGGTCHVTWGRGLSPVVRFELPDREAEGVPLEGQGCADGVLSCVRIKTVILVLQRDFARPRNLIYVGVRPV